MSYLNPSPSVKSVINIPLLPGMPHLAARLFLCYFEVYLLHAMTVAPHCNYSVKVMRWIFSGIQYYITKHKMKNSWDIGFVVFTGSALMYDIKAIFCRGREAYMPTPSLIGFKRFYSPQEESARIFSFPAAQCLFWLHQPLLEQNFWDPSSP